ncbi:MAG: hypothetical protein ABIF89_01570 [bacterium]
MPNTRLAGELSAKILQTKKYRSVYEKTVQRVAADCLTKYPEKVAEKKARNILHQIWGSYYRARPDFQKLFARVKKDIESGKSVKEAVAPLLKIHSSTRERSAILNKFYARIFALTGYPNFVIDVACGFNPLTFAWMNLPKKSHYFGVDIDKEQNQFIESFFKLTENDQASIGLADVLIDRLPAADVVFMLKLLPSLEQQEKGSSLKVLKNQLAGYLVVSFPVKSLSGKKKGMADFYSQSFEDLIVNEPWKVEKLLFDSELVFVIKK